MGRVPRNQPRVTQLARGRLGLSPSSLHPTPVSVPAALLASTPSFPGRQPRSRASHDPGWVAAHGLDVRGSSPLVGGRTQTSVPAPVTCRCAYPPTAAASGDHRLSAGDLLHPSCWVLPARGPPGKPLLPVGSHALPSPCDASWHLSSLGGTAGSCLPPEQGPNSSACVCVVCRSL